MLATPLSMLKSLGLTFSANVKPLLVGYVDANNLIHEDALTYRRFCYSLGEKSTACYFLKSSEQKFVMRSYAVEELYALDITVCDVQLHPKGTSAVHINFQFIILQVGRGRSRMSVRPCRPWW